MNEGPVIQHWQAEVTSPSVPEDSAPRAFAIIGHRRGWFQGQSGIKALWGAPRVVDHEAPRALFLLGHGIVLGHCPVPHVT
jgi:hypothetical protein